MKTLKRLYRIHSPSFKEQNLSKFVEEELIKIGITEYSIDKDHQIFRLIPNTPMINAHMDQVNHSPLTKLNIYDNNTIKGDSNLGADDKNGVWILLNILKLDEFKNKISFIFSTGEEMGGNIQELLYDHSKKVKKLKYGIVFDRKGNSDIIGTKNDYCTKELEKDIEKIGKEFGYKPCSGIFSDADSISDHISCVNLSCGYYKHHTKEEYTIIKDLRKSLEFGIKILNTLTDMYKSPEKPRYRRRSYTYDDYYNNEYADNYHNWNSYNSDQRKSDDIKSIIDKIDSGVFYYYCHTCYHWLPIKLSTIEKDNDKICPFCNGIFKSVSNMAEVAQYIKNTDKENYYRCVNCGEVDTDRNKSWCVSCGGDLELSDWHDESLGYYYCPDCDVTYDAGRVVTEYNKICPKCYNNLLHMH